MGKQSSRIYYRGKDHKDIYYNQHYHSAMYICEETEDEKVECRLVWRKIFDENLYIHSTVKGTVNSAIHILPSVTVNMDTKKVYLSTNYTFRGGKQTNIIYEPDWIRRKKYARLNKSSSEAYINKELIFNDIYKLYPTIPASGMIMHESEYPAVAYLSSSKMLTISKILIKEGEENEKDKVSVEVISRNLQNYVNLNGYSVTTYPSYCYNASNYVYMLARSSMSCILIRSDIDGNIKTLKLENFDSTLASVQKSPVFIGAKEEKVYLLATKVIEEENSETDFVINSITIIDDMEMVSTEAIDSWSDDSGNPYKGKLMAKVYMPTVSPMTFVYSRDDVASKYAHSSIVTIDENGINNADINIDTFNFFVNLYEDGEIVDTITVSSKYNCTDIKNGIVWISELSSYPQGEKTEGFSSTVHYTADGWVDGGTHGVFYDDETQYFYTFYIEKLYPSSSNFFIRFKV